jgi:Inorganic Pyrophosphatase
MPGLYIDDDQNADWLHNPATRFTIAKDGKSVGTVDLVKQIIETKDEELAELFYLLIDEGPGGAPLGSGDGVRLVKEMEKQGYAAVAQEKEEAEDDMPNEIVDTIIFAGLNVAIENPVGSVRSGPGWSVTMKHPYGYIVGSQGVDGDAVDVFIGPDGASQRVFVVHTAGDDAEDKVMLGFNSAAKAKEAFLANYSSEKFFDSMTELSLTNFTRKIFSKKLGKEIR